MLFSTTSPLKSLANVRSISPTPLSNVACPAPPACVIVPVCPIPTALTVNVPVPTSEVPRVIPFSSVSATLLFPLLFRLTAPVKSLLPWVRVIVPAPASIVDIPVTVSASFTPVPCVIAPPLDVADRTPLIVPVPKFKAPVEMAVSAPVFNVPSVNPLASVICVVPPVRFTASVKSLLPWFSVIAPVPAATVVVPKIDTVPAV